MAMQLGTQRYGMPNKEVQRSDQVSDVSAQAADADLTTNNLVYLKPEALSLGVYRSSSRLFFQRNTYNPGETAIIDFNSGTDFVDPDNSYLAFTVSCIGPSGAASFGVGSAMNVIRQVTLRSRSGVELDRVERANVWSLYDTQYRNPTTWFSTVGAAFEGWNQASNAMANVVTPSNSTGTRFLLPLRRISPFFRPMKAHQKIPPQLMSGLHMEIIWENANTALVDSAGPAGPAVTTSYQINNLSLMVDVIAMTDDVQKTINQQSADAGLEYTYPRVYTAPEAPGSSLILSSQVRKAVSQANYAWAVSLQSANYNNILLDSFAAIPWDVSRYFWRLGALYYPLQPLDINITDGVEPYKQVLEVFNKNCMPMQPPDVTLAQYQGTGSFAPSGGSAGKCLGIIAVAMEKDAQMDCSGLPVNNSRVLELNATFTGAAGGTREVLIFLDYNAVSRSYVDNTAVSI